MLVSFISFVVYHTIRSVGEYPSTSRMVVLLMLSVAKGWSIRWMAPPRELVIDNDMLGGICRNGPNTATNCAASGRSSAATDDLSSPDT